MVTHRVILTGAGLSGRSQSSDAPLVFRLAEQAFVPFFLDRLATSDGQAQLAGMLAQAVRNDRGEMRLYQPIHRIFNIVAVEALCLVAGRPRLDPQKIAASGICIRRRAGDREQAWVRRGARILGWRDLLPTAVGSDARVGKQD